MATANAEAVWPEGNPPRLVKLPLYLNQVSRIVSVRRDVAGRQASDGILHDEADGLGVDEAFGGQQPGVPVYVLWVARPAR